MGKQGAMEMGKLKNILKGIIFWLEYSDEVKKEGEGKDFINFIYFFPFNFSYSLLIFFGQLLVHHFYLIIRGIFY